MPAKRISPDELEKLARELRKLGWESHLKPLRELQAALRQGTRADWSLEHAARLTSYVGLGPEPLPSLPAGAPCPRCPPVRSAPRNTVVQLPDRKVIECAKCGTEWVTLLG